MTNFLAGPFVGSRHARDRRVTGRRRLIGWSLSTLTWVLTALMFFPVAWMMLTGLKTEADAYSDPPQFLFQPTLDSYREVLGRGYLPFLLNSIIASLGAAVLVLALGAATAYALAIRPVRRAKDVTFFYLSTRMLPVAAGIVPLYLLVRSLGLLDNINIIAILYAAMNLPIAVWMLRSFFAEVP